MPKWRTPRPAALRGWFAGWSRLFPSFPESPWNPGTARAGAAPPGAWKLRRRHRGGGEAGCEWSGHFLFLCSFPELWVVAAAVLRLPVLRGPGGVDSGPGTRRPAARSLAPARPALPEPAASRLSDRPPPPRPTERPKCRPSSVWWWETGECTTVLGATERESRAAPSRAGGTRVPAGPKSLELS